MSDSITAHVFRALRLITMYTDDPMNAFRTILHYSGLPVENVTRLRQTGIAGLMNPNSNKGELWKATQNALNNLSRVVFSMVPRMRR